MIIADMAPHECLSMLKQARLGRLACAKDNQPYVVPIYLVYHDPFLYGFTTPGQKVEWMRVNPLVCVEFDEIQNFDHWASVVIFGRFEELGGCPESDQERLRAYDLLRQHAVWWEPGSAARGAHRSLPSQAIYYRIRIAEITGRRGSPHSEERSHR